MVTLISALPGCPPQLRLRPTQPSSLNGRSSSVSTKMFGRKRRASSGTPLASLSRRSVAAVIKESGASSKMPCFKCSSSTEAPESAANRSRSSALSPARSCPSGVTTRIPAQVNSLRRPSLILAPDHRNRHSPQQLGATTW